MRTDVKVAAVVSLGVVVLAAFYYFGRNEAGEPIALNNPPGDRLADASEQISKAPTTSPNTARNRNNASGDSSIPRTPSHAASKDTVPMRDAGATGTSPMGRGTTGRGQSGRTGSPVSSNDAAEMLALGRTPNDEGAPRTLQEVLERGRQVDGSAVSTEHAPGDQNNEADDFDDEDSGATTGDSGKSGGPSLGLLRSKNDSKTSVSGDAGTRDTANRSPSFRALPGAKRHVVGKGDTLAILAEVYYGSQRHTNELLAANPHVTDPARLVVGTVLNVPALGSTPPSVATGVATDRTSIPSPRGAKSSNTTARPTESKAASANNSASGDTYSVRQGDSFYSISQTFLGSGSRWREIYELNREIVGDDPSRLRVGQTLKLPVSSSATASNTNG